MFSLLFTFSLVLREDLIQPTLKKHIIVGRLKKVEVV